MFDRCKIVKIWILHDTQFGNGKKLAEIMRDVFATTHDVSVGDIKKISSKEVAADSPDVIILGAAIRAFMGGPKSKKWMKSLNSELEKNNQTISYGGAFLTHALPTKSIQGYHARLLKKVRNVKNIKKVFEPCFTAQYSGQEGPYKD